MQEIDGAQPYFSNHANVTRWPFSIYHLPIERYVCTIAATLRNAQCLNIGCGFFHAYPKLRNAGAWSACDVDSRVLEYIKATYPEISTKICEVFPPYEKEQFDFILCTEVIEHLENAAVWFPRVLGLLKPGGRAVFSTPNYGISLLPLIEYTLLQLIAVCKGYSRFSIHPNKYSKRTMKEQLTQVVSSAYTFTIETCSYGMVLIADIKRTTSSASIDPA